MLSKSTFQIEVGGVSLSSILRLLEIAKILCRKVRINYTIHATSAWPLFNTGSLISTWKG